MPTTVVAVAETASEPPAVSARRRLRQTLNDALGLAAKAVKMDGEGDFVSSMEAYEQSISLLDKSIALMRENGSLAAKTMPGRDAEQEVAQLQRIRDKYSARIQAHRQEMGQFVQLASTLPALSPLSDYASTLPQPKTPRTPRTLPSAAPPAPPTAPLPPLPPLAVPPPPPKDYPLPLRSVPISDPYHRSTYSDSRSTSSRTGPTSPESPYSQDSQDSQDGLGTVSKRLLRAHASTPHLRTPLDITRPPGLPSRPSLTAMGITLPPPPSHPPPSPPSTMTINSHPVTRSPNSAPLVPVSNLGYNAPLKRTKSTKAYPSLPRPTTAPPTRHTYFTNRTEDAHPAPHANQPIPVDTRGPVRQAPWSSNHSVDSTGTSDESSGHLTMKPLRQPESPRPNTAASKRTSSTNVSVFSGSLHAQMVSLAVVRLPKLKSPSLRPKTAPSGTIPQRNRSRSTNNLVPVKSASGSEGRLFIPSKPVPLSPMSPPFPGGMVTGMVSPSLLSPLLTSSPNLLSPLLTSSPISFSTPGLIASPRAPTAIPQLPNKIPNFIATYSTVPSQRITAPKPPKGPTHQSFRTLRLVQASLGTPVPAPLSPLNPSQAQSHRRQGGGYVTDNLYVPCSIWHAPETWIFISNLGDKVKALETLQESLRVVQGAAVALFGTVARAQPQVVKRQGSLNSLQVVPPNGARYRGAQEWMMALQGLLATLDQLELGMGKKLGLGEGVGGSTGGSVSRTRRMKDWSTRVARKSFGVASGKSSGAIGVEYVEALGAVCAGVRMLDGHACAVARLTAHQVAEGKPVQNEDITLVETLAGKYQDLSPHQVVATRVALERIAAAMGTIVVPFILRDLGVLMESSLDCNGDADWMGVRL